MTGRETVQVIADTVLALEPLFVDAVTLVFPFYLDKFQPQGASIVRMMFYVLGEEAFFRGLNVSCTTPAGDSLEAGREFANENEDTV